MKVIKLITLCLLVGSSSLIAQDISSPRFEFGVSLLSLTREYDVFSIGRYRSTYNSLLNGYSFKYHKINNGSYRLRLRVIGQQKMGSLINSFDGIRLGDNYNSIGFEIALGYQFFFNKSAKRWKYYGGLDIGFINVKGKKSRGFSFYDTYKYSSISLNPLLGIRLKASRFLAFSWESNWVAGFLAYKKRDYPYEGNELEFYWNPVSSLNATIIITRSKKE